MATCEHCGSDRTNSPFPDCDCIRRNRPVSLAQGSFLAMIAGLAFGYVGFVVIGNDWEAWKWVGIVFAAMAAVVGLCFWWGTDNPEVTDHDGH